MTMFLLLASRAFALPPLLIEGGLELEPHGDPMYVRSGLGGVIKAGVDVGEGAFNKGTSAPLLTFGISVSARRDPVGITDDFDSPQWLSSSLVVVPAVFGVLHSSYDKRLFGRVGADVSFSAPVDEAIAVNYYGFGTGWAVGAGIRLPNDLDKFRVAVDVGVFKDPIVGTGCAAARLSGFVVLR